MKKYISYSFIALLMGMLLHSCTGDLNTEPLDPNVLTNKKLYSSVKGYQGVLAKCFASLILTGQKGGDGGNGDVGGIDEGYSGFTRSLFYAQELCTDEICFHAGSSHGSKSVLFNQWNPSTKIISYPYYRLYTAIGYCNEFLRECTIDKLQARGVYEKMKTTYTMYCAEARLIRAYAYSILCDLYGDIPYVDETMEVGTIPFQKSRSEIYNYVCTELKDLEQDLPAAGQKKYGHVDQAAAWFLLARVYLNGEAWIGEDHYQEAYEFCKKIIDTNAYPLAKDYRTIFLADNANCSEIIWGLVQDADNAQGSAGTNFLVKAMMNGAMNSYVRTGVGTRGWGNSRLKPQLVNKFAASDQLFDENDPWGDKKMDKRAQFFTIGHTKNTWVDGKDFQKNFSQGYACIKWRNMLSNRTEIKPGGTVYSSIDYPLMRTADVYLMAAEALLRTNGNRTEALGYVNEVRQRAYLSGAYGNNAITGKITDSELTLDFLLDERARELYTENIRRTDLIRFGKFLSGYNWDWKGSDGTFATHSGKDIAAKYLTFPLPQDEFTTNPNLTQNKAYK